jgi:hypothetical protein
LGLEAGWLAFVSGNEKRRLAPFPQEWVLAGAEELERLCAMARVAPTVRHPMGGEERRSAPRADDAPVLTEEADPAPTSDARADVEEVVRTFAHRARTTGLPAIEAMVQLKLLLADQFPDPSSGARDLRLVRRWFVEAFYFERES